MHSNFICESCKDLVVQFFIFKNNATVQANRHRKMIFSQIEDFLVQNQNIENIQVIRKLSSITLQIDEQPNNEASINKIEISVPISEEQDEEDEKSVSDYYEELMSETQEDDDSDIQNQNDETVVIVSDYLPCFKCDEVLTSSKVLEIHEFFKHSLLGIQLENEVEQSQEIVVGDDGEPIFIRRCASCEIEFYDSPSLKHHLLACHSSEILVSTNNEFLTVDAASIVLEFVNKYLEHIRDLVQTNEVDLEIDENVKSYFYKFYSSDAVKPAQVKHEEEDVNVNEQENEEVNKKLQMRLTNLNVESRAWLKREIHLRKHTIKGENGTRIIFRCAYCDIYSSNSAPGFRYHLISKHVKDRNFQNLQRVGSDFDPPPLKTAVKPKNICNDCNLKFKDRKMFEAHRNSHDLFLVIAEHYYFPACNTCNKLFIDNATLKLHLTKHDASENIEEEIIVPPGALMMQGRQLGKVSQIEDIKEVGDDFWWSCGHCLRRFQKEIVCRYHLLLIHTASFNCPIDKREFSEHKAVSLFSHHLRNKHPELFPNIIFSCTFCKMSFPTIYEKLSHMKNCSFKKFSCDHCGKRFFKKRELSAHMRFVSGELYFPCKICHKKWETMSDLAIHLRSHTKEVSIVKLRKE